MQSMPPIYIDFLNRLDIEALALTDAEIIAAIETSLAAQGRGQTVIEPRVHLAARPVERPFQRAARRDRRAGRPRRHQGGGRLRRQLQARLPVGAGRAALFDPRTGMPQAISTAPASPTCAPAPSPRSAPSTWRARTRRCWPYRRARHGLLERAPARPSVRLRRDPRPFQPAREPRRLRRALAADLGKKIIVTEDWRACVEGADIVVEASRLPPRAAAQDRMDQAGRVHRALRDHERGRAVADRHLSKLVVDDWGQCKGGPFGSLRAHVDAGKLSEQTLHAEMGQIVAGLRPGRETTTRPSCSGTAACPCATSRSPTP